MAMELKVPIKGTSITSDYHKISRVNRYYPGKLVDVQIDSYLNEDIRRSKDGVPVTETRARIALDPGPIVSVDEDGVRTETPQSKLDDDLKPSSDIVGLAYQILIKTDDWKDSKEV